MKKAKVLPIHKGGRYNLKCDFCKEHFQKYKVLNKHIIVVHGAKKFKCKLCVQKFQSCVKNSWYKHERTHQKNRVFCDVCNKGFQYDSSLRQHLRVHMRKGLFKCDKCTKQFTTKSVMKQHAKTHIDKGIFKCELCIFRSDTAYNLKQHMRGKHGRGWKSVCGHRFSWKSSISVHKKKCADCMRKN